MLENSAEPNDLSPRSSQGHRLVSDAAAANGIESDRARELLWLLNAPPDLSDLDAVLANLSEVLETAEAQWPGILALQGLEWLPDLTRKLLPVVISILPSLRAPVQNPGRDWVARNSLYCAMRCALSPTQKLTRKYQLLQAHYFFAHRSVLLRYARQIGKATSLTEYELYRGADEWPALGIMPYRAGLCI